MWKGFRWVALAVFSVAALKSTAQELDNTNAYRNLYGKEFIRVGGDDDFFENTDEEYTEGINLELVNPRLKSFPLTKLLISPAGFTNATYGIGIEHAGYTPSDIKAEFQNTGHPFASYLMLKTLMFAEDPYWKQTFSSALYVGVIGKAGLGEWVQDNAHSIVGQLQPPGWRYQVHNDVIINYQVNYEKQFVAYGPAVLSATTVVNAGTLKDGVSPGINLLIGKTSQYAKPGSDTRGLHAYIYDHPYASLVLYDGTLEGGMFVKSSPYTIQPRNVEHFLFANRVGFVLAFDDLNLEYYHVNTTPEYKTGPSHGFDGFQLYILLAEKTKKVLPREDH